MNAQAGDVERGFLRQQEHLAPPADPHRANTPRSDEYHLAQESGLSRYR